MRRLSQGGPFCWTPSKSFTLLFSSPCQASPSAWCTSPISSHSYRSYPNSFAPGSDTQASSSLSRSSSRSHLEKLGKPTSKPSGICWKLEHPKIRKDFYSFLLVLFWDLDFLLDPTRSRATIFFGPRQEFFKNNLPLKSSLFGTRVTMSLEAQCSFKATRNVVTFRFLSALHPQDPSKNPFHPSPTLTASNYKSYKPNLPIFKSRVMPMFLDLPSIP